MRQYSIFHPLILAWFHASLYEHAQQHWKGMAYGYLYFLVFLTSIPILISMQLGIIEFEEQEAPEFISQLPVITIINGELSIDTDQPVCIQSKYNPECLMVIDTSGNTTTPEAAGTKILITKTEAFFVESEYETRTYSFAPIEELVITQEDIKDWLSTIALIGPLIVFIFVLIFLFVYRVIYSLLYVVIGIILGNFSGHKFEFEENFSLAVISLTPPMIIQTVLELLEINLPYQWLLLFVIGAGYMVFGVITCTNRLKEQSI